MAFALVGCAALLALGGWQLERRAWKQDLLQAITAGLAGPALALREAPAADVAWRPAVADGAWLAAGLARIAPRTIAGHNGEGKIGADYAAPFLLANGDALVVVLGWAPEGAPPPSLAQGQVRVEGVLAPSPEPNMFTPDNAPPDHWVWLEPKAIVSATGLALPPERVSPLVLRLSAPPAGLTAISARPKFPNDHLQYALTWFALAFAWAVVATLRLRASRAASAGQP